VGWFGQSAEVNIVTRPGGRSPVAWAFWCALFLLSQAASGSEINYVIHVSVDGLRPDAITSLGPDALPNFYRLRTEGAFTDNARSDYDMTVTLPNHVTQLTGRGIMGPAGHNWTGNADPLPGVTLHSNKGSYVAGVFDVAHDNGLHTGAFVSKTKFSLIDVSWDAVNGAPDTTGDDNGTDKIDAYSYNGNTAELTGALAADMSTDPFNYAFLHLLDPDVTGHASGWDTTPGSPYSNTIRAMDEWLGMLLSAIDQDTRLAGHTAMIVTADHGGYGHDHADPTLPEDYTVPFYVWGPGVTAGGDLYAIDAVTRCDPGVGRPLYSDVIQPIRNGDAANLALDLLGLGPVPGSTINFAQDLMIPEPAVGALFVVALLMLRRSRCNT
jgi:predicted AlkP superfamily pyrophosphatase or phosphodiesterase